MNKTFIDYVSVTAIDPSTTIAEEIMGEIFRAVKCEITHREKGVNNFKKSILYVDPITNKLLGQFNYGGDFQRGRSQFVITGYGCSTVDDWNIVKNLLEQQTASRLTRTDIAYDTFDGSYGFDQMYALRKSNPKAFKTSPNSRIPAFTQISDVPEISGDTGRTFQVGSRNSALCVRFYEKGIETVGNDAMRKSDPFVEPLTLIERSSQNPCQGYTRETLVRRTKEEEFFKLGNWNRVEAEFKNSDRALPFDMLVNPDSYFAGINDLYASMISNSEPRRIIPYKKSQQMQYELQRHNHLLQVSKTALKHIEKYGLVIYVRDLERYAENGTKLRSEGPQESKRITTIEAQARRIMLSQNIEIDGATGEIIGYEWGSE